jgi:FkbM family methyltransferase
VIVAGIHLPDNDTHFGPLLEASERVDGRGTYQLGKLRRAVALVQHRGHAVDVGAQVGLWTRVLAREFQSVTAFEPVPEFAACLEANCTSAKNVTLHRFALGELDCISFINQETDVATARMGSPGTAVSMAPLDQVDVQPIDFLKIDAEGYEVAILQGAEETIRRDKPVVILEQKRKRLARYGFRPEAGVDLLRAWGAEVAWEEKGDWCLVWK